jgi:hypothetical protein
MLDFSYDPPDRSPGKPWIWMIIDSLIIAGIAFISALPGDRLPSMLDTYVALKAFIYSFLVQVAVERGLKPHLSRNKESREGENK